MKDCSSNPLLRRVTCLSDLVTQHYWVFWVSWFRSAQLCSACVVSRVPVQTRLLLSPAFGTSMEVITHHRNIGLVKLTFPGMCMVLAGLAEFILGNTFPFVVFTVCTFCILPNEDSLLTNNRWRPLGCQRVCTRSLAPSRRCLWHWR